jgi:DnaJ family protein C protein 28
MPNIDEQISKAVQEGKFNDLPGAGKPARLEENPLVDPEWRLAYHMLRESGYTLPWIELRNAIEDDLNQARVQLQQAWNWRQSAAQRGEQLSVAQAEWQRAVQRFSSQVDALNKRIFDYNLQAPTIQLQLKKLILEREVEGVQTKAG